MARISEPRAPAADRPALDGPAAFEQLFDTYARPLRGYLAGRVGEHAADDLVAETFLIAWRKRAVYDPELAPIRGWLYGIATNLVRTHVRQEIRGLRATARAHRGREHTGEGHDALVADRVDAQRRMRLLAGALAKLTEQERDVLLLTSWAGLEPVEVATALGLPASTVRSRLHRLRHRLQTLLTQFPQEDADE
ncbi:sigma-70 family RNA polymerase sigma factor [Amycolatopsis sp. 195334CR]|uniref:RNA polymerase sigma factor n=1 Tax=Amycolatopsis sp. 195334CR TaxID=2814588 RepID=UPI001A8C1B13|nr:sigma-70 family RNA polymerase sigma factor [Amycolatopsis sp. 195334CR]